MDEGGLIKFKRRGIVLVLVGLLMIFASAAVEGRAARKAAAAAVEIILVRPMDHCTVDACLKE